VLINTGTVTVLSGTQQPLSINLSSQALVNGKADPHPLQATSPHLAQWLDSPSTALSCTDAN
jgi:hypothetical protein